MFKLQVPWLRSGAGAYPSDGGCYMQVIDWIHRQMWTDEPPCVHVMLRWLGILVNDSVTEEERQGLLDLAPRVMGTTEDVDSLAIGVQGIRIALRDWTQGESDYPRCIEKAHACLDAADAWVEAGMPPVGRTALLNQCNAVRGTLSARLGAAFYSLELAITWTRLDSQREYTALCEVFRALGSRSSFTFAYSTKALVLAVDAYDELTGRGSEKTEVDWAPVCKVLPDTFVKTG